MAMIARRLPSVSPRVALLAGAALILAITLYAGREALGPFVVGLLLVYLLAPPVEFLARLRVPRPLAILLVYLAAGGLMIGGANLSPHPLVDQLRQFTSDLPGLADRLRVQLEDVGAVYRGLELPPAIRQAIDEWLAPQARAGVGGFSAGAVARVRAAAAAAGS